MHVDWTINAGHIITVVTIVIGFVIAWVRTEMTVKAITSEQKRQGEKLADHEKLCEGYKSDRAKVQEKITNDLSRVTAILDGIERRMGRVEQHEDARA